MPFDFCEEQRLADELAAEKQLREKAEERLCALLTEVRNAAGLRDAAVASKEAVAATAQPAEGDRVEPAASPSEEGEAAAAAEMHVAGAKTPPGEGGAKSDERLERVATAAAPTAAAPTAAATAAAWAVARAKQPLRRAKRCRLSW